MSKHVVIIMQGRAGSGKDSIINRMRDEFFPNLDNISTIDIPNLILNHLISLYPGCDTSKAIAYDRDNKTIEHRKRIQGIKFAMKMNGSYIINLYTVKFIEDAMISATNRNESAVVFVHSRDETTESLIDNINSNITIDHIVLRVNVVGVDREPLDSGEVIEEKYELCENPDVTIVNKYNGDGGLLNIVSKFTRVISMARRGLDYPTEIIG